VSNDVDTPSAGGDAYPQNANIITGTVGAYFGATIADAVARESDPDLDSPDTTFGPGDAVLVMGPAQNWTVRQPTTGVVTDHYKFPVSRVGDSTIYWVPTRNVQLGGNGSDTDNAAPVTGDVSDLLLMLALLALAKVG